MPRSRKQSTPPGLLIPALLGIAFLVLPVVALLLRAPWHDLPSLLADEDVLTPLRLSLETATAATLIALVLGVPLAWMLARWSSAAEAWYEPW